MGLDVTGLGSVADLAKDVIGRIWPNKTEEEKAQLAAAMTIVQGQLQINAAEATNRSVFVSGWRPFIGWVCGMACAWNWVGMPLARFGMGLLHKDFQLQAADLKEMLPMLGGLLGLGTLRTVEKINGVAAK